MIKSVPCLTGDDNFRASLRESFKLEKQDHEDRNNIREEKSKKHRQNFTEKEQWFKDKKIIEIEKCKSIDLKVYTNLHTQILFIYFKKTYLERITKF